MITISLSTEDLTKVRLAPSPLWETVTSFGVLLHQGRDTVHAPWATRARRVLPGTDLSALVAAMCVAGRCPDFLTPPPDASVVGFEEDLERVRTTPPEVVHDEVEVFVRVEKEQFGSLEPEKARLLEIYLRDPEGSLKRLVDTLRRYHDLAFAPYWPRIHEHLEGDTLKRGQALALGGVEALLSNLHPKASYSGGVLTLDKPYEAVVEPHGRGITLVPCVFAWPRVEVLVQPNYKPTLAYGPRGVANLWSSSSPEPNGTALGRPGCWAGVRAQAPHPHAEHHNRASPPTSAEPRSGLGPPLAAQGRRAYRATSQRQEGVLPLERRWRVAARDLRRAGVAQS